MRISYSQERAAREVHAATEGGSRAPCAADVRAMRLPYLEAIVLEALRLYAPAYMVGRCACRDATIGPYALPQGTTILVRWVAAYHLQFASKYPTCLSLSTWPG